MKWRWISTVFLTLMLAALSGSALAQAIADVAMLAEVGYGGTVLCGSTYPLEIEVTSQAELDAMLSVQVHNQIGMHDTFEMPIQLEAGETARFHIPVRPLIRQRTFEVTLTQNGTEIARTFASAEREVDRDALVIGMLGGDETLSEALRTKPFDEAINRSVDLDVVTLSTKAFPRNQKEMDAFDVLVVDAFDISAFGDEQQTLIEDWLSDGGLLIAGAGVNGTHSLSWLSQLTGVKAADATQVSGAFDAIAIAAQISATDETQSEILVLNAKDSAKLASVDGQCILAASSCGRGLALTFGVSLSQTRICQAFGREALWQRLLLTVDSQFYDDLLDGANSYSNGNRYSYQLNLKQYVSTGVSIAPVALLLIAYVAAAGFGLYAILGRADRRKLLWLALPLTSVAFVAVVAGMSFVLGLGKPAAASFTVAQYDEDGKVTAQEVVSLGYPQKDRVRITAQDDKPLERFGYDYYYGMDSEETTQERDRVVLGEHPSIEFPASAPWQLHSLTVGNTWAPEGSVTVRTWIEEDGLHAVVANDTDVPLESAVLLTQLGYAELGDIAAGEMVETLLSRTQEHVIGEDGREQILPGTMLGSSNTMIRVISACIYPEEETDDAFSRSSLSKDEALARGTLYEAMQLASVSSARTSKGKVACVLFAKSAALEATPLMLGTETIDRTAHIGAILARAAFENVSETGYFYYPEGTFAVHSASADESGVPVMGKQLEERYFRVTDGQIFAFFVEGIRPKEIERLCVVSSEYDILFEISAYDHRSGLWTTLDYDTLTELGKNQIERFVSEGGELFLRYDLTQDSGGYIALPQIIVEGSEKR